MCIRDSSTTKLLMAAVKTGAGREEAHEAIKEHAVAVALDMREQGRSDNDLLERLASDDRFSVDPSELDEAVSNPIALSGLAREQVAAIEQRVTALVKADPEAASYSPGQIS